jgi:hypothetical protein
VNPFANANGLPLMRSKRTLYTAVLALAYLTVIAPHVSPCFAQGTAFTYQGRLDDAGNPASGSYDLSFSAWNAASGAAQVGNTVTNSATAVSNGLFTVTLDFGYGIFTGEPRWLEIGVRTNGTGAFTILKPRQAIAPSPYALYTPHAGTAGAFSGILGGDVVGAQGVTVVTSVGSYPAAAVASGAAAANAATSANVPGTIVKRDGAGGFSANVVTASFSGNGGGLTNLPGIGWEVVTGTLQLAVPNRAYLASNAAARVTFTLPASAAAGDVVRVGGAGAGGWKIVPNSGQTIRLGSFGTLGPTWTARVLSGAGSSGSLTGIACSADGTRLIAVLGMAFGLIFTSTDSGVTWQPADDYRNWAGVALSADGSKAVAVVWNGQIYTSINGGSNWAAQESSRAWSSVASSADGSKLVAAELNGQIYTSSDAGTNWIAHETNRAWGAVASSADGTKLVAVEGGGQIYTSTDLGMNWTAHESNRNWAAVASSADGSKLVVAESGGQIYTSADSGASWTPRDSNRYWYRAASSADGSRLAVTAQGGQIYTSTNSGVSWTPGNCNGWFGIASSADGARLTAVGGTAIYTATVLFGTSLSGNQDAAIELQHIGGGNWRALGHDGPVNPE